MNSATTQVERNWLLACLEPSVRTTFEPKLRRADLEVDAVLVAQGDEVKTVVFPEGALIGLVSTMAAGDSIQTAMIGWDGALGVFEACGSRKSAFHAEVQVAGPAMIMQARDYRAMFDASATLRECVHKYVEVLLAEARQDVACNAIHSAEGRLSRAILEAMERSRDGRTLPMTQEALSQVLGVQRTTITSVMAGLQSRGAVSTRRGTIEVLEPAELEKLACCCRESVIEMRAAIFASREPVCEDD